MHNGAWSVNVTQGKAYMTAYLHSLLFVMFSRHITRPTRLSQVADQIELT